MSPSCYTMPTAGPAPGMSSNCPTRALQGYGGRYAVGTVDSSYDPAPTALPAGVTDPSVLRSRYVCAIDDQVHYRAADLRGLQPFGVHESRTYRSGWSARSRVRPYYGPSRLGAVSKHRWLWQVVAVGSVRRLCTCESVRAPDRRAASGWVLTGAGPRRVVPRRLRCGQFAAPFVRPISDTPDRQSWR